MMNYGNMIFFICRRCQQADKVFITKRTRQFLRQARQYIFAYFMVWKDLDKQQDDSRMDAKVDTANNTWSRPISIENKLVKQFKTHRCVCDIISHGNFYDVTHHWLPLFFCCSYWYIFYYIHTCSNVSTAISFDYSLTPKVNIVQINLTHNI